VFSLAVNTDIDQRTQQDDDTRIFSIDSMQTAWKWIYSHTFPWALHAAIFPYEMTFLLVYFPADILFSRIRLGSIRIPQYYSAGF